MNLEEIVQMNPRADMKLIKEAMSIRRVYGPSCPMGEKYKLSIPYARSFEQQEEHPSEKKAIYIRSSKR